MLKPILNVLFRSSIFAAVMVGAHAAPDPVVENISDVLGLQKLTVERPAGRSKGMVIYFRDGQGTDQVRFADLGYTLVTVDTSAYLSVKAGLCLNPSEDISVLTQTIQQRHPDLSGKSPVLLGSGLGGQLVYAGLSHAAPGSVHAGISLDFCPQLPDKLRLCSSPQSDRLIPGHLPTSWFVFNPMSGCAIDDFKSFIANTDNAKGMENNQPVQAQLTSLLQWLDPHIQGQVSSTPDLAGLPLKEIPAAGGSADRRFAVMLSGDGGWAALDRGVAAELSRKGIDTVGWDSLSYFWTAKTPEQVAKDLERLVAHYSQKWNKKEFLLIGYSFGADVLPFVVNRLSPTTRQQIGLLAFIGLSADASFEFHLSDWLGRGSGPSWPTHPEIMRLDTKTKVCIYGEEESDSACPGLEKFGVAVVRLSGDHHFGDHYENIVSHLLGPSP